MDATARAQFARYSYRKVNQVLGLIRGKSVPEALGLLPWVSRACRPLVEKTLKSAVANAQGWASPQGLKVSEAFANHGPVMKRVYPMAMGSRSMKKKKTCHLTIVVSDRPGKKG